MVTIYSQSSKGPSRPEIRSLDHSLNIVCLAFHCDNDDRELAGILCVPMLE